MLLSQHKLMEFNLLYMVLGLKQIADEMKPHPIVINILAKLSTIIPTWKIIPTNDIINSAIKNPEWRQEV